MKRKFFSNYLFDTTYNLDPCSMMAYATQATFKPWLLFKCFASYITPEEYEKLEDSKLSIEKFTSYVSVFYGGSVNIRITRFPTAFQRCR